MSLEIIEDQKLNHSQPTVIRVIGVGGGGCNAINRMIEGGMGGIDFIAVNTDLQSLANSKAKHKVQIGQKMTRGLGAGAQPDIGRDSAEEQKELLEKHLEGSDMVFVTAGMGGGTGTGATPVIANIAKSSGALTVAVVTKPFGFENQKRMQYALDGITELKKVVDTMIVVPNENLLKLGEELTINDTYQVADSVLMNGVKGISDLVVHSGHMNVDFADVQTIMKDQGSAVMCSARVDSKLPVDEILEELINNPLVEQGNINGAKGMLINVVHGNDTPMSSAAEIIKAISAKADRDSICINGFLVDEELGRDLKITLIATGFDGFEQSTGTKSLVHPVINDNNDNETDLTKLDELAKIEETGRESIDQDKEDPLSWGSVNSVQDNREARQPENKTGSLKEAFNEKAFLSDSLFKKENNSSPETPIFTLAADPLNASSKKTVVTQRKTSPVSIDNSFVELQLPFPHVDGVKEDDLTVPAYIRSKKQVDL